MSKADGAEIEIDNLSEKDEKGKIENGNADIDENLKEGRDGYVDIGDVQKEPSTTEELYSNNTDSGESINAVLPDPRPHTLIQNTDTADYWQPQGDGGYINERRGTSKKFKDYITAVARSFKKQSPQKETQKVCNDYVATMKDQQCDYRDSGNLKNENRPPLPHRQISNEWSPATNDDDSWVKRKNPARRRICYAFVGTLVVLAAVGIGMLLYHAIFPSKSNDGLGEVLCEGFIKSRYADITKQSNSSENYFIEQKCRQGMSFSGEIGDNVRNATCDKSAGRWTIIPDCRVAGSSHFAARTSITVNDSMLFFCQLELPKDFHTIYLARKENEVLHVLLKVQQHNATNSSLDILETPTSLKINLTYQIKSVECAHDGTYNCGISVGEIRNTLTEHENEQLLSVSDQVTDQPELSAQQYVIEDNAFTIQCTGTLGKTDEGTKEGMIVIQTKTTGGFVNATSTVTESTKVQCHYFENVTVTMKATSSKDNMGMKCVRYLRGNVHMESDSSHLVIIKARVSTTPDNFFIGEKGNVTLLVQNAVGLYRIELWRDSDVILNGTVNTTAGTLNTTHLNKDAEIVSDDIHDDSMLVILTFNEIYCAGKERQGLTLVVDVAGYQTLKRIEVEIYRRPETPNFSLTHDILEGHPTRSDRYSSCEAELGTPPGILQIWSDFGGAFQPLEDKMILEIKSIINQTEPSKCTRQQKITFALRVNLFHHRKHIRCVVVPAPETLSHGLQLYQEETVKVLPVDFCENNQIDEIALDPNNCHTYVNCLASLPTIAIPCIKESQCFKLVGHICLPSCHCGLTDIYVVDGHKTVQKNSEFILTCVGDGFKNVTGISIKKQSTIIASIGYVADNTLYEMVQSNVTAVKLSVKVKSARCSDSGEYTCDISGSGTRYTDTVHIFVLGNDCSRTPFNETDVLS